ncbi:enoyl-CoA hydratase [Yeosuana aromativorans]|uniref:Enoyl-CoA hydratase n=1 Tax=Yeosuana aromativorans TaxID=288019 RepID=A0A8J3FES7_9FLAO|nr:enoyl-CoA hydratase/isomerase family protein [Yeosuana aromativorans]GGK10012.1 enoyl-CoA hydratase [Yeosuana aromativorans]
MKEYVKQTIENGIGYIEFFHPAHNSLPSNLLKQLASAITDAGLNPDIKIVVLKSGGDRTFCAGASFNELISIDNAEKGREFFLGFANVINAMRTCPKFIIGRIQGKAVGGGVGLAAATDYCMATKHAAIKLSELNIGIGPFVVGPAIERKIGLSGLSQIAMDANTFYSSEWAQQKGLYTQVFETLNELDDAVASFSENLAAYNPDAMRALKEVFWEGTEDWNQLLLERAEISGKLVLSEFTKKKLKDFK